MAIRKEYIGVCILCILYGIILTGILLYVRFPSVAFKQFCIMSIEKRIPGVHCSIGHIGYKFPSTIIFHDIVFRPIQDEQKKVFEFQKVLIKANLKKLGNVFELSTEAYSGRGECRLIIKNRKGEFALAGLRIHHLNLKNLVYFQEILGRNFSGLLDFDGEYDGRINELDLGMLQGALSIKDATMKLLNPILELENIALQEVKLDVTIKDKNVTLEKGSFHGLDLSGTVSGKFKISSPWTSSLLSLKGGVTPLAPLLRRNAQIAKLVRFSQEQHKRPILPFTVSGTVTGPLFRFGN